MRVLLATDGSAPADVAAELIAGIDWPAGTTIRCLTAVQHPNVLVATAWASAVASQMEAIDAEQLRQAESLLHGAMSRLARSGATIESRVVRGRPATAVIDDADTWPADLVVIGSRGHGALASVLLGSVGAEIVDGAPCPVLVARRAVLTRVILAHDGSEYAQAAEDVVAQWPIFARAAIEVISVAQTTVAWPAGATPPLTAEAMDAYAAGARAAAEEHRRIAGAAAARLRAAGRRAIPSVVEGAPAAELVRVADARQADLIVLGTHGRTGLRRLVLGSVARNVLHHAGCSVMIVRRAKASSAG